MHTAFASRRQAQTSYTQFLPMLAADDRFGAVPAIWSHTTPPGEFEVTLFRHSFTTSAPLSGLQLAVFADTRYELWLDGAFMGRGPARFSKWTHEYDAFDLAQLSADRHVLAALVQWAPNERRSESANPILQARLSQAGQSVEQTGTYWKAVQSQAWNTNAAQVHAWHLIGPTELLDLTKLPANWMSVDFDDGGWPFATRQPQPTARYRLRSIPPLANVPMTMTMPSAGKLADGAKLFELRPTAANDASVKFNFNATSGSRLSIKTLALANSFFELQSVPRLAAAMHTQVIDSASNTPPIQADVDGTQLNWSVTPDWHPDMRTATSALGDGQHTLTFRNVPAGSWPVALSLNDKALDTPSSLQTTNAGRRLLLAEPHGANVAVFGGNSDGFQLAFNQPNAYAVLDLGRVVHGRIEATVQGAAGNTIDIGWDERLWHSTYPLPYPGSLHPQWDQTDSWTLDGSSRRISTIDARAGRYVLVVVWGDSPITLSNVRVLEERYPVSQTLMFNSSDARLNDIWRVGRDTVMLNMTDAYADPWRERGQWWGDATVIDAVNSVVFKDNLLLRRGLGLMAEQFREMPAACMAPHAAVGGNLLDYAMLWVQDMRQYITRTGDTSVLVEGYPTLVSLMAHMATYQNPATGLLDMPKLDWSQTALIDWAAFYNLTGNVVYGQSTPLNAMYYGALLNAAQMAQVMHDDANAASWTQRAERVRNGINSVLYLADQKRYASSIVDGALVPPTLFAQAWPLAYGVVPADRQAAVAQALLDSISRDPTKPNVQPYGMYWVLQALGKTGHVPEAVDLIKLYYGTMLDRGATTWWETWDANQDYAKALSHGWGSAPTWFLSTYAAQIAQLSVPGAGVVRSSSTRS